MLAPIVEALDYAWTEHHLVHGDIKPGNIILTEDGCIKLIDFSIAAPGNDSAACLGPPGFDSSRIHHYRPPELHSREEPSPQGDIYSLGILTYELLEGEAPFWGLREPWTPPPDKPKVLNEAQWAVLKRAMAYDAKERYDNVREFLLGLTVTALSVGVEG